MHMRISVRQATGFDWVDDTTSYGAHRWGWVAEHVGDSIELKARQNGLYLANLCPNVSQHGLRRSAAVAFVGRPPLSCDTA